MWPIISISISIYSTTLKFISSLYCAINGLIWFFVFENYLRHVRLYQMYQFVMSYIKWNYNFCLLPSWMWALLSVKLKKETLRWPCGQYEIISRCVHGFCLRETGRNACLCRSAQQFCTSSCHWAWGTVSLWMNTRCVAGRFFRKWRGIKVYLFLHMEKFSYSSKHALYFINYLCFLLSRRQHSIMWGSRGSQTIRGWACAVRTGNQLKLISSHRE